MSKNPYYLAAIPFMLVLILYSMRWGVVLPILTSELSWFIIIFIILLIIMGGFFNLIQHKGDRTIEEDGAFISHLSLKILIILGLTFIEGIYCKGFPVLGSISYSDFGIPFFHPLILTFNSYVLVEFIYLIGVKFRKSRKLQLQDFSKVILLVLPYILEVNRGMLVMVSVAAVLAFLTSGNIKITLRTVIKLAIIVLIGIYVFGLAGNYRTNFAFTGSSRYLNSFYIMSLGGADSTNIPKVLTPFYWAYIYLSSSLGNLQSTISQMPLYSINLSPVKFFIVQFLPDFLSKRVINQPIDTSQTRINPEFTTGSTFNSAYYLYSWSGIIITVIFILILPIILHLILKKSNNRYYVVAFSFVGSMYIFLAFDNMLSFTGLSLPIIYAIIGSFFSEKNSPI